METSENYTITLWQTGSKIEASHNRVRLGYGSFCWCTYAVGAGVVGVAWGSDKRSPVWDWRMDTVALPTTKQMHKLS